MKATSLVDSMEVGGRQRVVKTFTLKSDQPFFCPLTSSLQLCHLVDQEAKLKISSLEVSKPRIKAQTGLKHFQQLDVQ